MRKTILAILILIPLVGFSQETLREKFQAEKSHYTKLADQKDFTFTGTEAWADKFKRSKYWTNWLTVKNGGGEVNEFLAIVINDNDSFLIVKVKQLAQKRRTELKTEYQEALAIYQDAVDNNKEIPQGAIDKMTELKNLYNSYNALNSLTGFEVQGTWDGLIIQNGFSVFNELLVSVLNENVSMVETKYKLVVQQAFTEKKVALRIEAVDLQNEIDK